GIQDVPDNRLAAATRWVQEAFLPAVPAHAAVSIIAFDQSLALLNSNGPPRPELLLNLLPKGYATRIADTLETILAAAGAETPQQVLLCSDGIETERRDPVVAARLYRRKGIPIHTATFGTTNEMRDLILENVQVKRAVPNQSPTRVRVT